MIEGMIGLLIYWLINCILLTSRFHYQTQYKLIRTQNTIKINARILLYRQRQSQEHSWNLFFKIMAN